MGRNTIMPDNIDNHKLDFQLIEHRGYYFGKNFLVRKKIADRKPFLYVESNLESREINEINNSYDFLLKFDKKDCVANTILRMKHMYISLKGIEEKIPMWRTEHDYPDVYHYFQSKPIGWFLSRLSAVEKSEIFCDLRRVADAHILYIFYGEKILFCIPETVVDFAIVCQNCGRKLYTDTTKVIEQYGWLKHHIKDEHFEYFCCGTCKDRYEVMKNEGPTIRKEVLEFADAMEVKLRKNDFKQGWHSLSYDRLFKLLQGEMKELEDALLNGCSFGTEDILDECVDVGNFAMMIFNRIKDELKGIKNV